MKHNSWKVKKNFKNSIASLCKIQRVNIKEKKGTYPAHAAKDINCFTVLNKKSLISRKVAVYKIITLKKSRIPTKYQKDPTNMFCRNLFFLFYHRIIKQRNFSDTGVQKFWFLKSADSPPPLVTPWRKAKDFIFNYIFMKFPLHQTNRQVKK